MCEQYPFSGVYSGDGEMSSNYLLIDQMLLDGRDSVVLVQLYLDLALPAQWTCDTAQTLAGYEAHSPCLTTCFFLDDLGEASF